MIDTVGARRAAAASVKPNPVPRRAEAAPVDTVAVSRHVATPQQAARLPALNPAVIAAVVPYAVSASIGGLAMQATLHLTIGTTVGDVVYKLDNPAHPSLQAVGTIDDHTFKETWTFDDQGLHVAGSYGSSQEDLRLSRDADGYRLAGRIGDFDVDQRVTWKPSEQKLTLDGTLGGLPYRNEITIDNNPSMPEMTARGNLGRDATRIGYMAMPNQAVTNIDVSATGGLVGQRLEMTGNVRLMPPGTHPAIDLAGTMQVDGSESGTVKPGQPSHWMLKFRDASTNTPVLEFEREHEKFMHLIAVSRDLSTFAHLHPTYDPQYGHFDVDVNVPSTDPDNVDAASAVTKPGPTLVWAETKPKDHDVTTRGFTISAEGTEEPAPVTPDAKQPDGTVRKYFTADGKPGTAGDRYQITFSINRMPGMVHLEYNLQEKSPDGYKDVTNLQPWLGMMGHAIVVGAAGSTADDKFFAHLHAGHSHGRNQSPGPDEEFVISGDPPAGVYKIWGQFKHDDRILTLPFVFELGER